MTYEIEVSDDDGLVGHKDDALQGSIFVEPEPPEVLPAEALQFQVTGAVQLDPEPEPRPSATRHRVRRNARFCKAKKPAVPPVKLVSASGLKEACEALAPAGSCLLVLELFCGAGKVAKLASESGMEYASSLQFANHLDTDSVGNTICTHSRMTLCMQIMHCKLLLFAFVFQSMFGRLYRHRHRHPWWGFCCWPHRQGHCQGHLQSGAVR